MAGHWDDKDGNGAPLTDGRLCYVIESAEDSTMPAIRIYGRDKDEILEKAARTVETAQTEIHRLRKPAPSQPSAPTAPRTGRPTDGEIALAVADMQNPAKAPAAIKTLLRAGGMDVDKQQFTEALRNVANIAAEWERTHPEYPKDPRNDRILMKMAANNAGGAHRITAENIDAAFAEAQQHNMLFEPAPPVTTEEEVDSTVVQPRGTEDSRTRNATTYRRSALRSPVAPVAASESAKIKNWRTILTNGNSKQLRDAIENEPGFAEWVEKQTATPKSA